MGDPIPRLDFPDPLANIPQLLRMTSIRERRKKRSPAPWCTPSARPVDAVARHVEMEVVAVKRVEPGRENDRENPLVVGPVSDAPQESSSVGRRIFLERAEVVR